MNYKINTIFAEMGTRACFLLVEMNGITGRPASRPKYQCGEIKGRIHPFIHVLPPVMFSMHSRMEAGYTRSVKKEMTLHLQTEYT